MIQVLNPLSVDAKYIVLIVAVILLFGESEAQQRPQYSQYMFNGLILNPAYAGTDEGLNLVAINRSQWSGIDGAPVTQTFSGQSLFHDRRLSAGLTIINDKIGIHKNFTALGSWAYHLKISNNCSLSMGLQAGINNKRSDYSTLTAGSPNDPNQFQDISNTFFDLGVGVYFRSRKLQIGFSAPEFTPGKIAINDTTTINLNKANYFLFSTYRCTLNSHVTLEPSILFKMVANLPLSFDVNVNFVIDRVITTGVSYRKNDSFDFLLRLKLTNQLAIGYAYDFPIGTFSPISNGSNEIMINYVFRFTESAVSPR